MHLIEEVERNEIVTYKLKLPFTNVNWLFKITKISNEASFFINPGKKPKTTLEYNYKGISNGEEQMLITHRELNSQLKGKSELILYLTFTGNSSKHAATFIFDVEKYYPIDKLFVEEFVWQSGVLKNEELINYYVDFLNAERSQFSIKFLLQSQGSQSDLYVKECLDIMNCKVTKDDINSTLLDEKFALSGGKIFRYSRDYIKQGPVDVNQILMNFNCRIKEDQNFSNKYDVSNTCMFAIGIHNKYDKDNLDSVYKFRIEGQEIAKPLFLNESMTFNSLDNSSMLLKLELKNINFKGYNSIHFNMASMIGSCEIYLSKTNPYPDDSDYDNKLSFKRKNTTTLHTMVKKGIVLFDKPPKQIYILIKSEKYSVVDIYSALARGLRDEISEKLVFNKVTER